MLDIIELVLIKAHNNTEALNVIHVVVFTDLLDQQGKGVKAFTL
jgi:hypothetical protein